MPGRFAFAALLVATLSVVAAPAAAPNRREAVRIVRLPSRVAPLQSVRMLVAAPPRVVCRARLEPPRGAAIPIGSKATASGRMVWSFRIPGDARFGRWHAAVDCSRAGRARAGFLVRVPASTSVAAYGYSRAATPDGGTLVAYGGVIENRSPHEDALDVFVDVRLYAPANGLGLAHLVPLIPARGRYYLGFRASTSEQLGELAMALGAEHRRTRPAARTPLPSARDVVVRVDERLGLVVECELVNPRGRPLSARALVSAVAFDRAGAVLGGGAILAGRVVPAGGTGRVLIPLAPVPADRAAFARVSVEPRYG